MGAESAREDLRQTAVVEPSLDTAPRFPLGEVLRSGVGVPAAAITTALESKGGARLGEHLVRSGVVSEDVVAWAVAQQYGLPFIDLTKEAPQPEAVAMVTTDAARALQILPIRIRPNGTLDVVVGDPTDALLHRVLGALPVRRVRVGMAPPSQLKPTIERSFPRRTAPPPALVPDDDRRVRRVFDQILRQAATDRASDVHLEPVDDHVRVRFRVDGVLRESLILLGDVARPLLTYIKQNADLNDVRVATVPTVGGEHCVLHLRDRARDRLALDDLGMTPGVCALYTELARSPSGMIVVSGPARSGKTTTMFATLDVVDQDQLSVITVEDSIDLVASGVNQFCIDRAAGETFASGLVTIAGQDPDVILVGELPDLASARHVVRLATTGHFVVTSVHAMDAVDALWRLLDFGLEPREIASTVVAFESQRLLRRVCPNCVRAYTPSPRDMAFYTRRGGSASDTFVRGAGCGRCGLTGYQGRTGIFEVLPMTDAVTYELLRGADPDRIREIARAEGMHTLTQHALQLVSTQVTTIDEMRRTL
jgi:type IV pilus assembly protein PilB